MRKPTQPYTEDEQAWIDARVAEAQAAGTEQSQEQLRGLVSFAFDLRKTIWLIAKNGQWDRAKRLQEAHLNKRFWIIED